jgi:hypothetical protein
MRHVITGFHHRPFRPDQGVRRIAPTTQPGLWAAWSAAASVAAAVGLILLAAVTDFGDMTGWLMVWGLSSLIAAAVLGVAGGILALIAILGRRDRALVVYAALVPFAAVLLVVLHPLFISD